MTTQKMTIGVHAGSDFYNELRASVKDYFDKNNLSKHGNRSLMIKTLLMISLYFAPYLLMLMGLVHSPVALLFCWVLMGMGMAGVGMTFMHDANHGTFSKNPRVNLLLSKSIFLLGGFPNNWRYQHNVLHHGYTNIEGHDEDIAPISLLRFSPHKPLLKIHHWQHWYAWFFYGLLTLSWVTIKDFIQFAQYRNEKGYIPKGSSQSKVISSMVINKLIYHLIFLVIPLMLVPVPWYWIVVSFLVMHFVGGLILSTIFQVAHVVPTSQFPVGDKQGNVDNHWAVHQLLNTSDFSPRGKIFSWLIGGLNYQIEHHLFPNISHVHYRHLAPIVQQLALKHHLPYYVEHHFFDALSSHVKMLKYLGKA